MSIDRGRLSQALECFDRHVAIRREVLRTPGIVVVVRFEDEIVLEKAYGFANLERREEMTPCHIFRVASHSKMFTATAVMLLVERGELRLDDRLGAYRPDIPEPVARATIRQLLNHSSGTIRDGAMADYWQFDYPFPDATELHRLTQQILPANDHYKYSNIGYGLIGLVIEAITGRPYNDFVRENILGPLALNDTGPEINEGSNARLVTGYSPRTVPVEIVPLPDVETGAMSPATGFYSTAADLTRFAAAYFLGNESLLSDEAKREMLQPYWQAGGDDGHYGLGFSVNILGDRSVAGHGGGFPGQTTRTWFDPGDRLAVSVLTNETGGPASSVAKTMFELLAVALRSGSATTARDLSSFTGCFANIWGVIDIVQFGDSLYSFAPSMEDPTGALRELDVVDQRTLRVAKTPDGSLGESIVFSTEQARNVTRIVDAGMTRYPLTVFREMMARA